MLCKSREESIFLPQKIENPAVDQRHDLSASTMTLVSFTQGKSVQTEAVFS